MSQSINTHIVKANGFEFNVKTAGESGNPSIIFLHGWPESSYMWDQALTYFGEQGYFCIAPDQRGYSPKARPKNVAAYKVKYLIEDINAIKSHFGIEEFHLVAHDWGAEVGWQYIETYPEQVLSFNALSVPHGRAFAKAVKTDKVQRNKSWYMGFFQIPSIPEIGLKFNNFKLLRKIWSHQSEPEVTEYIRLFKQKGALTASINWYRANINFFEKPSEKVERKKYLGPVLLIYGNQDIAVGRTAIENNKKYINGTYTYKELNAGHWLMQEKPNEVIDIISKHIKRKN